MCGRVSSVITGHIVATANMDEISATDATVLRPHSSVHERGVVVEMRYLSQNGICGPLASHALVYRFVCKRVYRLHR